MIVADPGAALRLVNCPWRQCRLPRQEMPAPRKIRAQSPNIDMTVTDTAASRLSRLKAHSDLLAQTLRGIEKEGLRVDAHGRLAATPHPPGLGAAPTNDHGTTR